METTDRIQIETFFSHVRYSGEGHCYFAYKMLDNGHKVNFYARAAQAGDMGLLARGMEAFLVLAERYDDLMKSICASLDEHCAEYLDGRSAFNVLGDALDIVGIDANSLDDTRLTFRDSSQTMGGHFVVVDLDLDWKLKNVGLSDL